MNFEISCKSEIETAELATKLGSKLASGDLICLEGDLGAGKTTFTKSLAKAIGVTRTVNSPTFTIMKQYQGNLPFYHFDVYRIENEDEDFGFEEYFYGGGISVVEWSHLIASQLPEERLDIFIYYVNENERRMKFVPLGDRYLKICSELFE
ncbi:MAG: ATP-binding protein [Bacillales bacterium]|jgi:tRNA threonylcarbamoyladenosine biosynthesis protein TsaE|nr:ATP-binding protein [Bacillales bacterium]